MSSLAELFGDDRQRERLQGEAVKDDNAESLGQLLGPQRHRTGGAEKQSTVTQDTAQLTAIVDAAAANSSAMAAPTGVSAGSMKRPRGERRFDAVSIVAGAVALVAIIATSAFVGVQVASATPAASALQSLSAEEAALQNSEQGYATALKRAENSRQTALDEVARTQVVLATMGDVVDAAALGAANQAAVDYRTGLEALKIPQAPKPHVRGDIDEESLVAVGNAINSAQARSTEIDAAVTALRELRVKADGLTKSYDEKLAAFASHFPGHASTAVEAAALAAQTFRDAVIAAGALASTTPLGSAAGGAAMTAFRDAVLRLRADEVRAVAAQEADDSSGTDWTDGGGSGPGDVVAPIDPNPPITTPEPTDPTTPTDPTEPPGPTEPPVPAV